MKNSEDGSLYSICCNNVTKLSTVGNLMISSQISLCESRQWGDSTLKRVWEAEGSESHNKTTSEDHNLDMRYDQDTDGKDYRRPPKWESLNTDGQIIGFWISFIERLITTKQLAIITVEWNIKLEEEAMEYRLGTSLDGRL